MFSTTGSRIGRKRLSASLSGLYANRPAAGLAGQGAVYYATDVQEAYVSDGSAWTVIPCGGTELGSATLTSSFSTSSSSFVDVTGMSVTCKVGERPVLLTYNGVVQQSSSGSVGAAVVGLVANGSQVAELFGFPQAAGSYWFGHREIRVTGLTPGTSYIFKLQFKSTSGSCSIIGGGNDNAVFRVLTT